MSRPTGEVVEVVIEKLVTGGLGLARAAGLTVLVPLTAPGDRIAVRLVERRATWARGELVELLEPGPGRRAPPCPHYARCGGCDLQHLDDETQLRLKVEAATETLRRVGGVRLAQPPGVVSGERWGYRRRAQLHVEADEARGDGAVRVGQYARRREELVALECCPILAPALERRLRDLPAVLAPAAPPPAAGAVRLELAAGDDEAWTAQLDGAPLVGGAVEARVGPFTLRFDASCFFQGHAGMLEALVDAAMGPTAGGPGDAAGRDGVGDAADLYAGVGLFTLPLAARHRRMHAVESNRSAAAFLAGNAERNRVTNVVLHPEEVERARTALPRDLARVLVDPPRNGLSPVVVRALKTLAPRRLTYVSCDIATLARDLSALAADFTLEGVTFLDLFPQTSHVEAVAQLRRTDAPR